MAVLNVLGFKDPNTGLYACYCFEVDIVGAGRRVREAVQDLDKQIKDSMSLFSKGRNIRDVNGPVPILPDPTIPDIKRREDIRRMFGVIFNDLSQGQNAIIWGSSGHELHLYHFPSSYVTRYIKEVRDVYEEIMKERERGNGLDGDGVWGGRGYMGEEDIPF